MSRISSDIVMAILLATETPPLALIAASPLVRTVAARLPGGSRCGSYTITTTAAPDPTSQPAMRTVIALDTVPCPYANISGMLQYVHVCVGWWLRRSMVRNMSISLVIQGTPARRKGLRFREQRMSKWSIPQDTCCQLDALGVSERTCEDLDWLDSLASFKIVHSEKQTTGDMSHLGRLCYLRGIDISETLADSIDWVTNCYALEYLSIRKCKEISEFNCIGRLRHLISLDVSHTRIKDISWIVGCALSLECLDISYCYKVENVSVLANLRKLKHLGLNNFDLDGLSWIKQCNMIRVVRLSVSRPILNFSPLANLEMLTTLDLSGTNISDVVWISACYRLTALDISECSAIVDFKPIGRLESLKQLSMKRTSVVNIMWFQTLHCLELLDLTGCDKLQSFQPIGKLECLKELFVGSTEIPSIECVTRGCIFLERLDINHCRKLADVGEISNLQNLKELDMRHAAVETVDWVEKCCSLEKVYMSYHPADLDKTRSLESLRVIRSMEGSMEDGARNQLAWRLDDFDYEEFHPDNIHAALQEILGARDHQDHQAVPPHRLPENIPLRGFRIARRP